MHIENETLFPISKSCKYWIWFSNNLTFRADSGPIVTTDWNFLNLVTAKSKKNCYVSVFINYFISTNIMGNIWSKFAGETSCNPNVVKIVTIMLILSMVSPHSLQPLRKYLGIELKPVRFTEPSTTLLDATAEGFRLLEMCLCPWALSTKSNGLLFQFSRWNSTNDRLLFSNV